MVVAGDIGPSGLFPGDSNNGYPANFLDDSTPVVDNTCGSGTISAQCNCATGYEGEKCTECS